MGREMHWKRCLQRFGWMCSGSSAVAFTATFELGGHSLLALKVASRIRKSLEIDVPLAKLFDLSTIAGVANEVRREAPVVAPSPRIHG